MERSSHKLLNVPLTYNWGRKLRKLPFPWPASSLWTRLPCQSCPLQCWWQREKRRIGWVLDSCKKLCWGRSRAELRWDQFEEGREQTAAVSILRWGINTWRGQTSLGVVSPEVADSNIKVSGCNKDIGILKELKGRTESGRVERGDLNGVGGIRLASRDARSVEHLSSCHFDPELVSRN